MIFTIGPFVLYFFLLLRLVILSGLSPKCKALAGMILLPLALPFALNRIVLGSGAAPELPAFIFKMQGWCFFTLILLLCLLLLYDLFRLGRALAKKSGQSGTSPRRPFSPDRRKAVFALLAACTAAYGVKQAVDVPDIHDMEVPLRRLPKELDGLTLAQVSDLHASALLRGDRIRAVVERVNALKADLVLFTGDTVDGRTEQRWESLLPLREIKADLGVYACVGNHEYYSGYPSWIKAFPQLGLKMLLNSHALIAVNRHRIVLAGLTDTTAAGFSYETPDLNKALAGTPEDAVRILLDHRPSNARQNSASALNMQRPVDLQLSGHTHGGQIAGMNHIVKKMNQGFVYGWYEVNGMPMYVSSGAGLWGGFPIRLGVPSEIARIVLRAV
ncbi:MAG: metallophosphoesterase [Deltaproteobacteria bacterium]|nr:metallophosphoesterase [Deltaproteobacteria bacterium]